MYPESEQFDARLPRLEKAIRISGLYDAQVFARRWAIRDKDPELKALIRQLDRVDGGRSAASALGEFRRMLEARGLLIPTAKR